MSKLSDYQDRFEYIRFRREDGVLEMAIHEGGKSARWGFRDGGIHEQLGDAFYQVARDRENKVVIFTGAGDNWLQDFDFDGLDMSNGPPVSTPAFWDRIYKEGKDLIHNLLDIEVPVIGAVNGNAWIHSELIILSDILLAAEHTSFADKAHFLQDTVPGDGVHAAWELLVGPNRSRHMMLTGAELPAAEAKALGVVAEILPAEKLNARAWEIARDIAQKSELTRRYTRMTMMLDIKRRMSEDLSHSLLLEGLSIVTPAA